MSEDERTTLLARLNFAELQLPPVVFAPPASLDERCASLANQDVDPGWLGELAAIVSDVPLLDSSASSGLGAGLAAAANPSDGWFLADPDPGKPRSADQQAEVARGLAQLVVQLDRVMAWAGAHQAAAMAALGRPGVAVPVGDLLDAVTQGGSGGPIGVDSADALCSNDFDAEKWQQVSVHGDPAWDDAVCEQASRIAATEVGAQLVWSPATARSRMAESADIVDNLPLAHQLWSQGRLDRARVMVLADRTDDLDPVARELVEEQLLAHGGATLRCKTPARVRAVVDRCVAELDPDAVRRRQERARQDRDVFVSPRDDGMSRFCADVSAPTAVLARSVIDSVAQGLSSERSIGQRRADVFADLFTRLAADGHVDLRSGAPADAPQSNEEDLPAPESTPDAPAGEHADLLPTDWEGVDSGVTVVVDASVLDGVDLSDQACIEGALLGSHPALPADLVQALALSARRARIAIRGVNTAGDAGPCASGCASARTNLTVGADVYRPSAKLAEQLVLRDRVCRFPGCRHPAGRCDLDHRVPFAAGGPTTAENLDALCRFHHRVKTFTGWRAVREPGNRLIWTTPLGARIADDPELVSVDEMPPGSVRSTSSRTPPDDPPPF
ncbi:MAG: DUF222 domain-containing protein [Nakamurella sp.]